LIYTKCHRKPDFHARWCATGAWVTGGEVRFRKDVLAFSSTKNGQYAPLEAGNSPLSWYISPFFDFASSIKNAEDPTTPGEVSYGKIEEKPVLLHCLRAQVSDRP
jgi:hypothetical protein